MLNYCVTCPTELLHSTTLLLQPAKSADFYALIERSIRVAVSFRGITSSLTLQRSRGTLTRPIPCRPRKTLLCVLTWSLAYMTFQLCATSSEPDWTALLYFLSTSYYIRLHSIPVGECVTAQERNVGFERTSTHVQL